MPHFEHLTKTKAPLTISETTEDGKDETGAATTDLLRFKDKSGNIVAAFRSDGTFSGVAVSGTIPVFNVRDYGASESASAATNAAAFRSARDDANASGSGTVVVPSGDYDLDIGETWLSTRHSSIVLKDGVHWVGIGSPRLKIPVYDSGVGGAQSVFGGAAQNWSIRGIRMYGNNTVSTGAESQHYGVYVQTATGGSAAKNFRVEDCEMYGFQSKGVFVVGNATSPGSLGTNPPTLFRLAGLYVHDMACGNALGVADGADTFEVEDCWLVNSLNPGAAESLIFTGGLLKRFTVRRVVSYGWGNMALQCSDRFTVEDCYFEQPSGGTSAALVASGSAGLTRGRISNCTFDASASSNVNAHGAKFTDASPIDGVNLVDNTIVAGSAANCLQATMGDTGSWKNSRITGNRFYGVSFFGGDFTGSKIIDNNPDSGFGFNPGNGTGGTTKGAILYNNSPGYITENEGTATIASGNTSVTVTHGMYANAFAQGTLTAKNIIVTPTNNPTNDPGHIWVDSLGGTTFNINCRANPGVSGLSLVWKIVGTGVRS